MEDRSMVIPGKYLLFLGDAAEPLDAKTASGLADWRPESCVGQWRLASCRVDLGLKDMTPGEARAAGAETVVIGVTPFGGAIAPAWVGAIIEALQAGLNVASGMHSRLCSIPAIAHAAQRSGRTLFDVRFADRDFPVGSGRKRSGRRLLMVGTDCAVGKKYTALVIAREMEALGMKATFRATGQTGILIAGGGIPIDAVVADFISGAAESLSPDNDPDHWDVIEGQGSLFHPAYSGVATGLLHGSQPDAIVMCHERTRTRVDGYPDFPLPSLRRCINQNLEMARLTSPDVQCVGISINTSGLTPAERASYLKTISDEFDLPCFDPISTGASLVIQHIVRSFG
jgi:uncharacterized NAD-dependent epimerase/dehydratase family protein